MVVNIKMAVLQVLLEMQQGHSFILERTLALGRWWCSNYNDPELAAAVRALANYESQKKYVFKYKVETAVWMKYKLPFWM